MSGEHAGDASRRFPGAVARLNFLASQAVLLELCRQALADGSASREEIAAFLADVGDECRAMLEAAKERGK